MADLIDRHDVIVLELGVGLGFIPEPNLGLVVGRVGRIAPPVGLDQLECYKSARAAPNAR